jgi:hypothetical protein
MIPVQLIGVQQRCTSHEQWVLPVKKMRHLIAWMKNERDEVAQCKSENGQMVQAANHRNYVLLLHLQ